MTDDGRDEHVAAAPPDDDGTTTYVEAEASDEAVLEHHYRRWLRAYPEAERAARGDEIVADLIAGAAEGQLYPTVAERWELVRDGLRARWPDLTGRPVLGVWAAIIGTGVVVLTVTYAVLAILTVVILLTEGLLADLPTEGIAGLRMVVVRFVGWSIAALSVLAGRLRLAGVVALVVTTAMAWTRLDGVRSVPWRSGWSDTLLTLGPDLLLLAAVAVGLLVPGLAERARDLAGPALVGVAGATVAGAGYTAGFLLVHAAGGTLVGDETPSALDVVGTLTALATAIGLLATAMLAVRRGRGIVASGVGAVAATVLVDPVLQHLVFRRVIPFDAVGWLRLAVFVLAVVVAPVVAALLLAPRGSHDDGRRELVTTS